MRRSVRPWAFVGLLLPLSVPARALATHPDYEGEQGIELQVGMGVNAWGNTSDSVTFMSSELVDGTNQAIGGPGFGLRASVGYRFNPWISAGVTIGWNTIPSAGQYTLTETNLGAQDSYLSLQFGVYVRFYALAFVQRRWEHPRVFFTNWTDPRRFDPWVSLGVDFVGGFDRTRTYTDPKTINTWSTAYYGIPIGIGGDYRLTQSFSVGLALTLTPLFAGSVNKTARIHNVGLDYDTVTTTMTSYTPASTGNFETFFGLTARYTFTF